MVQETWLSGSIGEGVWPERCVWFFTSPVVSSLLKWPKHHHLQTAVWWAMKEQYLWTNTAFYICKLHDCPSFEWPWAELFCQGLYSGRLDSFQHEMSGCQAHIEYIGTKGKHFCKPLWCTSTAPHTVLLQSGAASRVVPQKQTLACGWMWLCMSSWSCTRQGWWHKIRALSSALWKPWLWIKCSPCIRVVSEISWRK